MRKSTSFWYTYRSSVDGLLENSAVLPIPLNEVYLQFSFIGWQSYYLGGTFENQ